MAEQIQQYLGDLEKRLEKRKVKPRLMKDIANFPLAKGQALYVLDYRKNALTFQNGIKELFGYDKDEFTMKLVTTWYHPDDKDMVQRLMKATLNYATENDVSVNLGFFVTYRVKHKAGHYIKILRQSNVFDMDEDGKIISNTSLITDIDFLDSTKRVQWKFDAPGLNQQKFKEYVSKAYSGFFTERESEIIALLRSGLSSLDISEKLHISRHTVDTHRRKILQRANCKNTIELLNFCEQNGLA